MKSPDTKEHKIRKAITKGTAIALGGIGLGTGVHYVADAYSESVRHDQEQQSKMNQVIEPAAVKIAQFALDHKAAWTNEPILNDGKYNISLGTGEAGQTTISVDIRKVGDTAPQAADVSQVIVQKYLADPTKGGSPQVATNDFLRLNDSEWTANREVITEPPYDDDNTDHDTMAPSYAEPNDPRSFADRLDATQTYIIPYTLQDVEQSGLS